MSQIPESLRYSKSHEWVRLESDGLCTVGITDFAQNQLGDIVFIELPVVGDTVAAGQDCAVIESVKSAADLYAPIAGTVVEINHELDDSPDTVNVSAYDDGWLFKIKPTSADSIDQLLSPEEYKNQIAE